MSPDGHVLRTATLADAAAIRALTRAAYAQWVPLIGREPLPMTADHEAAVTRHRVDLLEIDGSLAALVEMVPAGDHLMVENLAVAPSWQRRGLGHRMMAHAEAVAGALNLPEIRLYTNSRFTDNLRLYRGLGFAVTREEVWRGGVIVHMRKPLRFPPPAGPA